MHLGADGAASLLVSDLYPSDAAAACVRDEGDGTSPDADKVFQEFWRSEDRRGPGLGLYIVNGLIESPGGLISMHGAPGGGAEFRLIAPAGTAPSWDQESPPDKLGEGGRDACAAAGPVPADPVQTAI